MNLFIRNLFRKLSLTMVLCCLFLFAMQCEDGPSIEVDGTKLTVRDLKSESPQVYAQIKKQHDEGVMSGLQQLAVKRMIALEAKSKGIKPKELMRKLQGSGEVISQETLKAEYQKLKKMGQIGDKTFEEILPGLTRYLKSQSQRKAYETEVSRLRKKYGYVANDNMPIVKVDVTDEPMRGVKDAPVTIVEFTDFRCGYCRKSQETSRQLREKYGDKIRWIVKDSPFQPGGREVHIAANCVFKQDKDKYWKFFDDTFMGGRSAMTPEGLEKQAKSQGVDMKAFATCLNDSQIDKEIQGDLEEGRSLGVNGTPAFFINGRMLSGAQPIHQFVSIIDSELE